MLKFKERLEEAWGPLTDDELDRYEGQWDRLIGYLQKKTGQAEDQV